eukprot:TRINITY_DN3573_c0_g1_i1.p1 TRINITY_DN3573_c0_g1~~TRINITY_DN3573_c0_g1_i1.p1  ORF type:complete len:645 (+),score=149.56 TRINITY_DN3573_c0_g1_i1:171-1937(+)
MAPTRELATQIHAEIKKFQRASGLTSICVYGGAGVANQIGYLKRGAEIVVCTPGRMIDILCANKGRITNLRRATFLVLDEADRMFDMGFQPQIMRIINNIRPDRQTVLTSATFPQVVEKAAREILQNPIEITIRGTGMVADTVEQYVEVRDENTKFKRLMELITHWFNEGSILVFVDRQESADSLWREISKSGYAALSLHGGKDQVDRTETIEEFKNGSKKILVATSVAARGLDVAHLRLVINYDVPNHLEDYVHRVGRTGRAGRQGTAYTFITPEEAKYAKDLVIALKGSNAKIPAELQALSDEYQKKIEAGVAKKRKGGFSGQKGFKFDEDEAAKVEAKKLAQRTSYLNEEETELTPAAVELLSKVKQEEDKKRESNQLFDKEKAGDKPVLPKTVAATPVLPTVEPGKVTVMLPSGMHVQLPATLVSDDLQPKEKDSVAQQALKQVLRDPGVPKASSEAAKKASEYALELIRSKVAVPKPPVIKDSHFTAEIEINDYPQTARWKVTHKDALSQITEDTGCAITARGQFCAPGKVPAVGERKLYLFIEGSSMDQVNKAKLQIKRVLEEATLTAHPDKPVSHGRYSLF